MSDLSDQVAAVQTGLAALDVSVDAVVAEVAALEATIANGGDVAAAVASLKTVAAGLASDNAKLQGALPQPAPAPTA